MSVVLVAVSANPYYEGTKVLDGNTYSFLIRWNTANSKWYMDIKGLTNSVDIAGIALLPGFDLFDKYGYSELGALHVVDNSEANEDPNFDDMGGRFTVEYTPLET